MLIVADENIPGLDLWTKAGHEIVCLPGRSISPSHLKNADLLLVRSVTPVNKTLLADSNLAFIGTATSGTNHIDLDYIEKQGIPFACAAGANAQSVVDYVFSVLAVLNLTAEINWLDKSIGIVGGGNIGGQLCRQLSALGVDVRVYDPYLDDSSPLFPSLVSLDEVLACEVVSLHVPLTEAGRHPTFHLIDEKRLAGLKKDQVLINTSRGEVVDNIALLERLQKPDAPVVILDVWENEPAISAELARKVFLGSPHIAGYSAEGKIKGSRMLFDTWQALSGAKLNSADEPVSVVSTLNFDQSERSACESISSLILQAYDVREEAQRFDECLHCADLASCFDRLRKHYPVRHEFSQFRVSGAETPPALMKSLQILGFQVS